GKRGAHQGDNLGEDRPERHGRERNSGTAEAVKRDAWIPSEIFSNRSGKPKASRSTKWPPRRGFGRISSRPSKRAISPNCLIKCSRADSCVHMPARLAWTKKTPFIGLFSPPALFMKSKTNASG